MCDETSMFTGRTEKNEMKTAQKRYGALIGHGCFNGKVRYYSSGFMASVIIDQSDQPGKILADGSLAEPDPYAGGEGLVNCYTSTRTIGMHLRHRATHIRDVTIGLIVLLVH